MDKYLANKKGLFRPEVEHRWCLTDLVDYRLNIHGR